MNPDLINALFELVGGGFTWTNAWYLYQAKQVKGVFWPTWLFFTLWGMWNLLYYPLLDQWYSFAAGVWLVSGNAAWVILAVYYTRCNSCKGCTAND